MAPWISDALDVLKPLRVSQPFQLDQPGTYTIRNGKLEGPGVFYIPTSVKFYKRPSLWVGRPVCVALHYTGCHSPNKNLKKLNGILDQADDRLLLEKDTLDRLIAMCDEIGYIPDAVGLTLQNAGKKRWASWCLCIGSQPLPDGTLPIVQYSPDLSAYGTMHAGTPDRLWAARKKLGSKPFSTSRGEPRWDGKNYGWPIIDVPGTEETTIVRNINSYSIGMEVMHLGLYGVVMKVKYPGLPSYWGALCASCHEVSTADKKPSHGKCLYCGKKVKYRQYEKPSSLQVRTVGRVIEAIRDEYGNIPTWGHRDFTKAKVDPWPPFPRYSLGEENVSTGDL